MDDAQVLIHKRNLQEIVDSFESSIIDGEDAIMLLKCEIRRLEAIYPPPLANKSVTS